MKEEKVALLWDPSENGSVVCNLCPRRCHVADGKSGYCAVRYCRNGVLYTASYGHPVAVQVDPIEKKPLKEFLPGTKVFSIGTFGCNLGCVFCQNDSLSRGKYSTLSGSSVSPEIIVEKALQYKCKSLAFTYNEPLVFLEYILAIAPVAREAGLPLVWVSNGFYSPEALEILLPYVDAANIDMKGFSEMFYQRYLSGHLQPVLDAIEALYKAGKHLEITTLIIPGVNDKEEELLRYCQWLEEHLSKNVPLHFSAFYPAGRALDWKPTPPEELYKIRDLVCSCGFEHVYLGNI